jgi:hypothetical protein
MEIRVRDGAPSPPSLSRKSERKARVAMECSTIQLERHERLVLCTVQKYLPSNYHFVCRQEDFYRSHFASSSELLGL